MDFNEELKKLEKEQMRYASEICFSLVDIAELKNKFITDRVEEIENYHYELEKREPSEFEKAVAKRYENRQYILRNKAASINGDEV